MSETDEVNEGHQGEGQAIPSPSYCLWQKYNAMPSRKSARCLGWCCTDPGSPFPVALDLLVAAAGQLPGNVCPRHHLIPAARPLYENPQLLIFLLSPWDAPLDIWVDLQVLIAHEAVALWRACDGVMHLESGLMNPDECTHTADPERIYKGVLHIVWHGSWAWTGAMSNSDCLGGPTACRHRCAHC